MKRKGGRGCDAKAAFFVESLKLQSAAFAAARALS